MNGIKQLFSGLWLFYVKAKPSLEFRVGEGEAIFILQVGFHWEILQVYGNFFEGAPGPRPGATEAVTSMASE